MATMTVERNGKVIGAIVGGLRLVPVRVRECEHDCDGPIPGSGWKAWAIGAYDTKGRLVSTGEARFPTREQAEAAIGDAMDGFPNNTCPQCGASRGNGHADDCPTRK